MSTRESSLSSWSSRALSLDRAWLATGAIFLALSAFVPEQAGRSFAFTLDALIGISPFLVLSVAIAAYAKASGADSLIALAFKGRIHTTIVMAALIGGLSPFCSCGVIPLIAAMLAMGVPLSAVMAFWLASPLMDPAMFVLTVGTLGVKFAIGKTVAAVGIGLLGGFGTLLLQRAGLFDQPLREGVGGGCGAPKVGDAAAILWPFWREADRRAAFWAGTRQNIFFLGKWLVLAFLLESLMIAYVPADLVSQAVGQGGPLQVLGATIIGVPAYLNGFAALPLVSGLIEQGMAPGAAMAFLLAGGVSSIPAAIAVYALARPPVFAAYLGYAFLGAMTAGMAYGLIV